MWKGDMEMKITLEKYQGLGNDYFVLDPNKNKLEITPGQVKLICDRNYGAGADGILVGPVFEKGKISVKVYNPDGSEAEKCGNGATIFAKYMRDAGYVKEEGFTLSMLGGDVDITYLSESGNHMRVDMGRLTFWSDEIPVTGERREVLDEEMVFGGAVYRVTCAAIGNPHCIIQMDEISKEKVCEIGAYSESAEYFPNRINTQLLQVINSCTIRIEAYERGAGYTLSTGTGCCAAAGAAYRLGLTGPHVAVHMPGGEFIIDIKENDTVCMTATVGSIGTITLSEEFTDKLFFPR